LELVVTRLLRPLICHLILCHLYKNLNKEENSGGIQVHVFLEELDLISLFVYVRILQTGGIFFKVSQNH